jgi:hypothetical protein
VYRTKLKELKRKRPTGLDRNGLFRGPRPKPESLLAGPLDLPGLLPGVELNPVEGVDPLAMEVPQCDLHGAELEQAQGRHDGGGVATDDEEHLAFFRRGERHEGLARCRVHLSSHHHLAHHPDSDVLGDVADQDRAPADDQGVDRDDLVASPGGGLVVRGLQGLGAEELAEQELGEGVGLTLFASQPLDQLDGGHSGDVVGQGPPRQVGKVHVHGAWAPFISGRLLVRH